MRIEALGHREVQIKIRARFGDVTSGKQKIRVRTVALKDSREETTKRIARLKKKKEERKEDRKKFLVRRKVVVCPQNRGST